ncbi:MAG: DUF6036 family nucleotidyltransferase [Burkholderiales bacterium]
MKKLDLRSEYDKAFREILSRVQQALRGSQPAALPIRMYIAGGAALHLLTGQRVTEDIDAVFSKKVVFDTDLSVAYRDADGRARMMYLDRSYNDTLGLMHEDAYADAQEVDVPGIDRSVLEVRVLTPLDLAVTKLARFADVDREDIETLARRGLIDASSLRERAQEALGGYVGNLETIRTSLDIACRLVDNVKARKKSHTK